jgi:hypothetical protein
MTHRYSHSRQYDAYCLLLQLLEGLARGEQFDQQLYDPYYDE